MYAILAWMEWLQLFESKVSLPILDADVAAAAPVLFVAVQTN